MPVGRAGKRDAGPLLRGAQCSTVTNGRRTRPGRQLRHPLVSTRRSPQRSKGGRCRTSDGSTWRLRRTGAPSRRGSKATPSRPEAGTGPRMRERRRRCRFATDRRHRLRVEAQRRPRHLRISAQRGAALRDATQAAVTSCGEVRARPPRADDGQATSATRSRTHENARLGGRTLSSVQSSALTFSSGRLTTGYNSIL